MHHILTSTEKFIKSKVKEQEMKNKKSLVIFCAVFALAVAANAQITFGPVSGVSFSKFKVGYVDSEDEPKTSNTYKIGFHFGATADIPFGGRFGLQPSILFSQKGNKMEYIPINSSTDKDSYSSTQSLNYIEVPLLFKYKLGSPDFGLALMAGPSFAFGINGKHTDVGTLTVPVTDGGGTTTNVTVKINESDKDIKFGSKVNSNFKGFDAGFTFGVGTYFEIGESGKLIIEARYTAGFGNILNSKYISEPTYDPVKAQIKDYNAINNQDFVGSVKNKTIQLSIGYLFEF